MGVSLVSGGSYSSRFSAPLANQVADDLGFLRRPGFNHSVAKPSVDRARSQNALSGLCARLLSLRPDVGDLLLRSLLRGGHRPALLDHYPRLAPRKSLAMAPKACGPRSSAGYPACLRCDGVVARLRNSGTRSN